MGIVTTRYEDAPNNNITFDYSKFDYFYDSNPFKTDTATDFDTFLEEFGDFFFVEQATDTNDTLEYPIAITNTEFRIYAYKMDISKKDRQIQDMGLAVPGNSIMYVLPSYSIVSGGVATNYVVKEGDVLLDRVTSQKLRVVKIIHEPYINNTQIYKKIVVKNIDLDGSP